MADPDHDRVQDRATERSRNRADTVETILDDVERHLGELEFPVTGEELAAEYGSQSIDLPNETESLGSALERIAVEDEEYHSTEEVREAVYGELTGEAAGPEEYNLERDLDALDEEREGATR